MDKEDAIEEFLYEDVSKSKGLVSFFKTVLGLDDDGEEEVKLEINEFSEFLEDIPDYVSDEDYDNVKEITVLCSQSINITSQKMQLLSNSRNIEREMHNTRYIADLSDEEIVQLKKHIDVFSNLSKESTRLMYKVTSFNKSVSDLVGKTDMAKEVLPEIEHAEKQQKKIKADIFLIEQERSEIYEQYDSLNKWLGIVDITSKILLCFFAILTCIIVYIGFNNGISIFYYNSFLIIALIVLVGGMYIAKLKIKKTLKLNIKKQARAVEILNKKNTVLAHHTNFLNYEYKKFNVSSSTVLRGNIIEFQEYKVVANRKNATRRALEEAEEDLKNFFKTRGKSIPNMSVEKFIKMIDVENKKLHYDRLVLEGIRAEEEVERLDQEQGKLWEEIERIQKTTTSQKLVINDILKAYYSKLDKIMSRYKEVFESKKNADKKQLDDNKDN